MAVDAHQSDNPPKRRSGADPLGKELSPKELRRGAMSIVYRLTFVASIENPATQRSLHHLWREE